MEWDQLKKKYKSDQAIFAQLYQQYYLADYELDRETKVHLSQAAQVFAKAFIDDRGNQLSEKSLQDLKPEYEDLFSRDAYYEAYKTMQKYMK